MKKFLFILLTLLVGSTVGAQSITISGGCLAAPVTLNQATTPQPLRNGKVHYRGSATVNVIPDGPVAVPIEVYWLGGTDNVWVIAYEFQAFYESSANTPRPPGSSSAVFSWVAAEASLCGPAGAPANLSVTGPDVVLPVTFGTVDAFVKNDALHINWTTEKEVNNDHFEIEASKDGAHFTTLSKIASQAEGGNSDITLSYEWTSTANLDLASLSYIAAILAFLLLVRRKKRVFLGTAVLSILAFSQISCKKDSKSISDAEQYYIRIAQVDKDGTKTYSKVVHVKGD